MDRKIINIIIAASSLALVALIFLQARWMWQARKQIEAQFDEKVSMAVCSAVEKLGGSPQCSALRSTCAISTPSTCNVTLENIFATPEFDEALRESLTFYKVDLDYEIQVHHKTIFDSPILPANCCGLKPIMANDNHYLSLNFPGKNVYFFKKMWFMTSASILIILVITSVFVMANYALIRQKQMMEINKEFFNNMAHEFRTPITNISLATSLLGKKQAELQGNRYLGIVNKESQHLMEQVNRILDFATLEKGSYPLKKEDIDLRRLITEIVDSMDLQLKARRAKVKIDLDDAPIPIYGDRLHLGNSIKNLIDNALKHNTEDPNISIQVVQKETGISLRVEDDGKGIEQGDQAFIFDQFYRSKKPNSFQSKGFGMGLAYVKKIVELHQGTIQVFSELGRGTRFDVFLPAT